MPYVDGAVVEAEVLEHTKGPKVTGGAAHLSRGLRCAGRAPRPASRERLCYALYGQPFDTRAPSSPQPQLTIFKFRPKKHYKRKTGHRQPETKFLVKKASLPCMGGSRRHASLRCAEAEGGGGRPAGPSWAHSRVAWRCTSRDWTTVWREHHRLLRSNESQPLVPSRADFGLTDACLGERPMGGHRGPPRSMHVCWA